MWMRPSWDSQYTRTKTEEATTPYYTGIPTAVQLYPSASLCQSCIDVRFGMNDAVESQLAGAYVWLPQLEPFLPAGIVATADDK